MSLYEFHGWFTLWPFGTDNDDTNIVVHRKNELIELMSRMDWLAGASEVLRLNGEFYLRLHGNVDYSDDRLADIDRILDFLSLRLSGSHGMLHERFDPENASSRSEPGAFRVRVMTRGAVQVQDDPFFSHV